MITSKLARMIVLTIGAAGLMYSARELYEPSQEAAAATCCIYGADCGLQQLCCTPSAKQTDCSSPPWINYCRPVCGGM
jgi:hypothetical protein